MSSPRSLQARSKSSTRVQLARDLHDSLAQDLVAIGYKLDLLIAKLPIRFRAEAREVRFLVSESTAHVRRELFGLREKLLPEAQLLPHLTKLAKPLSVEIIGDIYQLNVEQRRIVEELVRNAATHSKGRTVTVEIFRDRIRVSDDGQGLFGIKELLPDGDLKISVTKKGMSVEVQLP
jgi:signal transduction histidine kinase